MGFRTELELQRTAMESSYMQKLVQSFSKYKYFEELKGFFGIPDLVVTGLPSYKTASPTSFWSFAFEMKLSNWKTALSQAFRYTAFTYKSFVVIDHAYAHRATRNLELFTNRNIGLLSVDLQGDVYTHFEPRAVQPYSKQLQRTFTEYVSPFLV